MSLLHEIAYGTLGVAVGALGTLIGAGGGFALLPVLVMLNPHEPATDLTAISLVVVCANSMSGSLAYARQGRIDRRSALLFTLAGLPGSILGAWLTHLFDRRRFDPLLGLTLILSAGLVFARRDEPAPIDPAGHPAKPGPTRTLVERDGTVHRYAPRVALGMSLSLGVGTLSSLLGTGGGFIHVPAMVYLLGFPTHIATATSHAVLAALSFAAVVVHATDGTLVPVLGRALPIAIGALIGAQLGARLSTKVQGRWILRALGVALLAVGARLLFVRVG